MAEPSEALQTLNCPNCGAPLQIDNRQPTIQCQYCNTVFDNPHYQAPPPEPVVIVRPAYQPAYFPPKPLPQARPQPKKASGCIGVLTFLIITGIVLGIGVGAYAIYAATTGKSLLAGLPTGPALEVMHPAILLPDQSAGPQVIALTRDLSKETYAISRVDLGTKKALWSALGQSDYLYPDALVAGDSLVYVIIQDRLIALQLTDGKQAWEATLPDKLYSTGINNVLFMKGQVVVLTTDNSLGAYDALTGHQTWEKHYTSTGWKLYPLKDSFALAYSVERGAALGVVDAATGEETTHIEPTCQAQGSSMTDEMEFYSNIVIDGSQSPVQAYIFFGLFNACIQRWNLDNGQVVWEYIEPNQNLDNSRDIPIVLSGSSLFYVQDNQLRSMDTAAGAQSRVIDTVSDYALIPRFVDGNHLVLRATRTRGTTRYELWTYDLQSGKNLWKDPLLNSDPLDPPDPMAGIIDGDTSGWTYLHTPGRLDLITFQSKPFQVTLAQINLDSGAQSSPKILSLGIDSITDILDTPDRVASSDNLYWATLENQIYAIDPVAGVFKYRWP